MEGNRKSEKYLNSRRDLSGRLKCKFLHKSLSASASSVSVWVCVGKLYLCAQKMLYAGGVPRGCWLCLEWISSQAHAIRHLTADKCVSVCVCEPGNPSLSLNEMKTADAHTLSHTHTVVFTVCTCTDMF